MKNKLRGSLYIKNINVITMDGSETVNGASVLVEDGRIAKIDPEGVEEKNIEVLDGLGGYLMPGLFDMHVHLNDDAHLPLFLLNGITGIREMGNTDSAIFDTRQKLSSGSLLGPTMYVCGPILEGDPPLWDGFRVVKAKQEALDAITELKGKEVDFIKAYHTLNSDLLQTIIDREHSEGLKVTGHVSYDLDAAQAIGMGQDGIEHMNDIAEMIGDIEMREACEGEDPDYSVFTGYRIKDKALNELLGSLSKDIYLCPTLVLNERMAALSDYEGLKEMPELEYIDEHYQNVDWNPSNADSSPNINDLAPQFFRNLSVINKGVWPIIGQLAERGTLLAGSDTPNPFVVPGFSLIRELELLVETGISNHQALAAATVNGAEFLGQTDKVGTISTGKIANMIVLEDNPLEDITALKNIKGTILNGIYYTKEHLEALALEQKRNS